MPTKKPPNGIRSASSGKGWMFLCYLLFCKPLRATVTPIVCQNPPATLPPLSQGPESEKCQSSGNAAPLVQMTVPTRAYDDCTSKQGWHTTQQQAQPVGLGSPANATLGAHYYFACVL
ncbi:hypothetical protein LZ32DRAFT_605928 [Colletotrichum eremochloae]|nr:hypothetical protein LZ32DRAFT_605928 [Colletotrichum eremochloae]